LPCIIKCHIGNTESDLRNIPVDRRKLESKTFRNGTRLLQGPASLNSEGKVSARMMTPVVVAALVVVVVLWLMSRRNTQIICDGCGRLVAPGKVSRLSDGRSICKACVTNSTWEVADRTAQSVYPAVNGTWSLRPSDRTVGRPCAVCGQPFRPMDAVCKDGRNIVHALCAEFADGLAELRKNAP